MTESEVLEIITMKELAKTLSIATEARLMAQDHAAKIFKGYLKTTHIEGKGGVSNVSKKN